MSDQVIHRALLKQVELYLTLCRKMPLSANGEGLG
jgi:hypothetical protein